MTITWVSTERIMEVKEIICKAQRGRKNSLADPIN